MCVCIYIKKNANPSTKSTRHVDANVNIEKENQDHQNSSNEVKDNAKRAIYVINQLVMEMH